MYEYKVISGQIEVNRSKGESVETVLADILNEQDNDGWEFYTHGTTSEIVKPGCLAAMFGKEAEIIHHQTFIFRRKFDGKREKKEKAQQESKPSESNFVRTFDNYR